MEGITVNCTGCLYADKYTQYCGLGSGSLGCTWYEEGAAPEPTTNAGNAGEQWEAAPLNELFWLPQCPFPMSLYLEGGVVVLRTDDLLLIELLTRLYTGPSRALWYQLTGDWWRTTIRRGSLNTEALLRVNRGTMRNTLGWLDITLPFERRLQLYALLVVSLEHISKYMVDDHLHSYEATSMILHNSIDLLSSLHDHRHGGYTSAGMRELWQFMGASNNNLIHLRVRHACLVHEWRAQIQEVQHRATV